MKNPINKTENEDRVMRTLQKIITEVKKNSAARKVSSVRTMRITERPGRIQLAREKDLQHESQKRK